MKKIIFSLTLVALTFSFIPTNKAQAYTSWPDFGGNFFGNMLDQVFVQVQAAIVGALKKAAIETVSETINNLVSGVTKEASLFISDWEDYLFNAPHANTKNSMNDFFTLTTRGRSSGNYASGTCGKVYSKWRTERAKQMTVEIDLTSLQDTYQEYACDAIGMFSDGSWAAYNAFMEPRNNPLMFALIAEEVALRKEEEEKAKAQAQAIANQGFISKTTEEGYVITPGSLIQGLTLAANTIDNDAIASAKNIGEVVGLVVGKIASGVIKQGIGNARAQVQSQINNGICDMTDQLGDQLDKFRPGKGFSIGFGLGSLGTSNTSCR